jgi:hypothetical protein
MSVMPVVGLILDVSRVDCDTTGLLLRGAVDLGIVREGGATLARQDLGNGGGEGCLAVVDVSCTLRQS